MIAKHKVCHITTAHPQTDIRIFHKQCKSLAKAGYEVVLLVGNGTDDEIDGVRIVGVSIDYDGRLKRFLRAGKALYEAAVKENAEIYHFHDPEFLPFADKLAKAGCKVIFDSHENVGQQIMSKYYIPKPLRSLISWMYVHFERLKIKKLSAVIGATDQISQYFRKVHSRTLSVMNFPLLNELPTMPEGIKRETQVAYVGGISTIRCAYQMVDMLEHTPAELKIGGGFSPSSLKVELEKRTGWEKVEYLGYLDRTAVWDLYAKCSAGLVLFKPEPNHLESQPNKMFEYMMAGLPVIGSDFPLWKEIIEKESCGICINSEDVHEIAEAVNKLLADPELIESMGRNGRKAVEKKFNWSTQEAKLLDLYKDLLND
ncbi:MAG: glycosyltransferase involved in cell wall biosynthesis [Flavobacteriales bacterium]|jgi:glycosyltransferase involved in cell wall biosynthesis